MKNILNEKWGIDTNLLIYALDSQSPHFSVTKQLFETLITENIPVYICQQNIIEAERILVNVYKIPVTTTVEKIIELTDSLNSNILNPFHTTLKKYHDLLKNYKKNHLFDLFLAATYLDNDIHHLLTANTKDFAGIADFTPVAPLSLLK